MSLVVSTVWNADRRGGQAAAIRELRERGHADVELAGPAGDLAAVPAAARELRVRVRCADGALGRRPEDPLEPDFASTDPARRERHLAELREVAAAARRAGTNRVILRCGTVDVPGAGARLEDWGRRSALGGVTDDVREEVAALLGEREARRDAHLDAACRSLHRLVRSDPETDWWILPAAAPHALPLPDEIEHLLAEVPAGRPAYVHDVASATVLAGLGVAPADAALRAADRHLAALRLSDAFGLETGLPPGSGSVDWKTARDAAVAGLARILHVTRPCSAEELAEAVAFVGRAGM